MNDRASTQRDEPDWIAFVGWQGSDEDHPVGAGVPAYRIVFKTMRAVVAGDVTLYWADDLRITAGHGRVKRGGVTTPGALAARQPGKLVLPEFGHLVRRGKVSKYEPTSVRDFVFNAWEDELEDVFYVEFLLRTRASTASEQIVEGRERLAELKTMLDLRFGPRFLGVLLTEEVGEVFSDWHFNRAIAADHMGHEFQLDVIAITSDDLREWNDTDVARYMGRPIEEKRRLRLGSQWYWLAIHDRDRANQYLELWFVLEVLAMPDTTNIRPIRDLLSTHAGGDQAEWGGFVGRHFNRRSELVHGNVDRSVSREELECLRTLVEAILEIELSTLKPQRADELRKLAGLT